MRYLAHINDKKEEQLLKEHLVNTAKLCAQFAAKFGVYDWGYCCGLLHDIGKYSPEFQKRIRGSKERVDHSTAGAKLCWNQGGMYQLLSYCIAGHHAGLPDAGGEGDTSARGTLRGRLKKNIKDYRAYIEEIAIPRLTPPPFHPGVNEDIDFFFSVFIRMLYSCLVDADYLDTEAFMSGGLWVRSSGESIDILCEKFERHISAWLENNDLDTINGRRTEILKHCLAMGKTKKGLFTMTVPTGGGKTVASLAFALKHAKEYHMDRIIYVIPYTSIIEQNAKVFSDILGSDNVLENHYNVDYESREELKTMQLAAENWDKPVVITTNVQFFESLFSNKSSKCRKLHNIVNSIIIFDEAQMLPNDYLKPCVAVIEQLVRHYHSSVILCTATQPALKNILSDDMKIQELCPRMAEQFLFFKRVSIKNLNRIPKDDLIQRLEKEQRALCILNTRKRAQEIYQRLQGEGVYHLSTSMYPIHRKRVLNEIKERLARNEKCVVISTSLVEAGVDLDFDTVYRQLSGVDSIIQAAGRCNREGKRPVEDSMTYIFQLDEREYIPGQRQQMEVTESLLEDGRKPEELETIRNYFKMLYHLRGESLDKKNILKAFKGMNFPFAEVSKEFKLIEEDTKTLFIPKEKRAIQLLEELKIKGVTKKLIREMGQYCISVYENDFKQISGAGMVRAISEEMKEDFFELTDLENYTEDMGLNLKVESGSAVIV